MKQVTFRGTGQLNGSVIINKTIELNDETANSLLGPNRNQVKLDILSSHFPGVKIDPNQIGCEVQNIKEKKTHTKTKTKVNNLSKKKSFSILSIITFLLFLPFKIVWWLLKSIWNDENHI